MRRAACCWTTKLWPAATVRPARALRAVPPGSAVLAKSRLARYFASLAATVALGISLPSCIRGATPRRLSRDRPHGLGQLIDRERVQHVALANAGAPRHRDREPDRVERPRRVRVARQDELDAAARGLADVHRVE